MLDVTAVTNGSSCGAAVVGCELASISGGVFRMCNQRFLGHRVVR